MGKVREEQPPAKAKAGPAKSSALRNAGGMVVSFAGNLLKADIIKPSQGKIARRWTGIGLGVLLAAGIYRLYVVLLADSFPPVVRFSIPLGLTLALGWLVFRTMQYPPFVDFLIVTEAEMNKVSWTTKADLYRATTVVLVTVLVMAIYLFGVDWLWSTILQQIGVLRFGASDLGSQAG